MKKNKSSKLFFVKIAASCVILGLIGLIIFSIYGGNNCNYYFTGSEENPNELIQSGSCDCFCCQLFGLKGYESCGIYGFFIGLIAAFLLVLALSKYLFKAYR